MDRCVNVNGPCPISVDLCCESLVISVCVESRHTVSRQYNTFFCII